MGDAQGLFPLSLEDREREERILAFVRAIDADALAEGEMTTMDSGGRGILLARVNGQVCAVIDLCSHQAAKLSGGRLRRGMISCPLHGARFELATGNCIGGAYENLQTFDVREQGGWIEVDIPEQAPEN